MIDDTTAFGRLRASRPAVAAAIVIGLTAIAVAAALSVTGIRLFAVQTPSMGETAPVGSLVVTHPQATYAVGDIISFTIRDRTVTHRIVGEAGDGFATKGDLNGAPDGWRVPTHDVIGRAIAIVPGAGFVLTAAPWLVLGGIATEVLGWFRRARPGWLWSVRLIGSAAAVTAVTLVIRPWFNMRLLDFAPAPDGDGALLHVVNTGTFPLLAGTTRLVSGQAATVLSTDRLANGAYSLTPIADPDGPVRLLLVILCLLPFVIALLARQREAELPPGGLRARPDRRAGRIVIPVAIVTVIGVVVLITVSTTAAAFSATIRNTSDTAGTNPYFTCRDAERSVSRASTWAAFELSGTTPFTERDFSGNGRTGFYDAPRTTSDDVGCVRDRPRWSVAFTGSQCLSVSGRQNDPNVFSLEAWFSTTAAPSGKIIGFGDGYRTPNDPRYWDRHIFLDDAGRVVFGLYPNGFVRLTSPAGVSYADGEWHSVVANLSGDGAELYVDGKLVDANRHVTTGQDYAGYWRIGCGRLTYWTNGPSTFTGRIQYAAIYRRPLTALEVQQHDAAGR